MTILINSISAMATTRLERPDVQRRKQSLISDISDLIQFNSPDGEDNFYPQHRVDLSMRAFDLGYFDILHFCRSFPNWFVIHSNDLICLHLGERNQTETDQEKLMGKIIQEMKAGPSNARQQKINDCDLLRKYRKPRNTRPPLIKCSIVKGDTHSIAPINKPDFIHFKFTHDEKTRRFTLPRDDSNLIESVKQKVNKIIGAARSFLYWNDEESLVVLECDDDMCAAIDFAQRRRIPPCIVIEATVEEAEVKMQIEEPQAEEKKDIEQPKIVIDVVVSRDDSRSAFNGFAFVCDSCDAFLAPSNGGRYKCIVCDNYDLCASCVAKGVHDNHALIRLMNGETIVTLSDGNGGMKHAQVKDTPRCTPSFVVLQNRDKPVELLRQPNDSEVKNQTTWDKVQETMDKQKTSYEKQKESRMNETEIPQKTEEQKRREQNLQNALKHPFEKMQAEDEEVWRILKKERELQEKTFSSTRIMREEEIEERIRIDGEMKKLSQREEIMQLEMEQMKIEKALMELRMRLVNESPIEGAQLKQSQNKNEEHNELWSAYEMWKQRANEKEKEQQNDEKKISEAKKEQGTSTEIDRQRQSFSSDGSDLEIIEMIHESESVLDSMQVIHSKMDRLLLQPATESTVVTVDPISIGVEETAVVPPPSPSPDYEMPFEPAPLIMSTEQYALYIALCDTGIFDDFSRMAEVCRSADNLDQAIDMMLDDAAPIQINPAEYI